MSSFDTPNTICLRSTQNDTKMQWIFQGVFSIADIQVVRYELLYRGLMHKNWVHIDTELIKYLGVTENDLPPLLVNVSNDSVMEIENEIFIQALKNVDVVFELSELISHQYTQSEVFLKINELVQEGVRFAIDDFGAGIDGIRRLYSIEKVHLVKIEAGCLHMALDNKKLRNTLNSLIKVWHEQGLIIVAEGIEKKSHLALAEHLNFDLVQGFYLDEITQPSKLEFL